MWPLFFLTVYTDVGRHVTVLPSPLGNGIGVGQTSAKDPGLLMKLKRLMAKWTTDRGQIVAEQDLEDDVIMDRLVNDQQFRALATRLLQRYGYLTPQLNPQSPAGQDQQVYCSAAWQ